ncbi:hypothetical protein Cgig2_033842 [Carnegiea gigantea]|uniref:PB1-like domain-containing protein n=1 Tax=Carnegiea gigantea TaxID=171969 RepID=A0A9Q1GXH4_9CARY|nr:hypothetical protein Cgig2_033842 [Carnegiea gigantea]
MTDEARKDVPVGGLDDVTLEINYRERKTSFEYKGGKNRTLWPLDTNLLSYFEVKGFAEDVHFTNIQHIYYVIPWLSIEDGIRPLKTDYDSLEMVECAKKTKKISVYIVHKVDGPLIIPIALPSCEAKKETYGKRVKHVATKRMSPRGKVPPLNAKVVTSKEKGPITTVNNS